MTTCRPDEVGPLLRRALDGGPAVAPVADGPTAAATLAMLRPEVPLEHDDVAAVVATSGSTGTPKGVMLSRGALLAAAGQAQQVLGPMTWTCVLPTGYVAGLMVLVRAHLAGTAVRHAASDLSDLDAAAGPNAISIVPTQLFRALERPDVLRRLARFDAILLGGAAVDAALLADARDRGLHLVTTYGMSETAGGCVWDGAPQPGVEVALDEGTGRITLAGPMAFSGYRLRPDLTVGVLDGDRVLTNDRGAWHDGRLRVLGRLDDVVVSGGVNVDLAAVQRAVEAIEPGASVVVALPDAEWGQRVVLATTGDHDVTWWRTRLGEVLDRAALPRAVARRDVLPRTTSGKIDRQSLVRALLDEG